MSWNLIGLPGRGPWQIEPDCPAQNHNTLNAARGKYNTRLRCVCPRGVYLLNARKAWEAGRVRKARTGAYVAARASAVVMPDLSTGACATGQYRKIAQDGQTDATYLGAVAARDNAKNVCRQRCPVMLECRAYILAAEQPAGSWGSVWGGLDPDDRKRLVRAKH